MQLLVAAAAPGQLAITEVMTSAATNLGPTLVAPKSDFWELTNFGTNALSLHGYAFADRDSGPEFWVTDPFTNCIIGPGESIIFLRSDVVTNRQGFLNWWGANNLPAGIQVRTYPKPGFNSEVDALHVFGPAGNLVDSVELGRARRGHTFVYDTDSGEFGSFAVRGVNGAFKAVQTDDVGSPGTTPGPVPITIVEQPSSLALDAGQDAEFTVRATGLPRPRFQWFHNNVPVAGATQPTLVLTNVQPHAAGNYRARLSNGLATVTSEPATLAVNTTPSPAAIITPPEDVTVFENQRAVFSVRARGFPAPSFQWQRNGASILGATNPTLVVSGTTLAQNGTLYTVRVQNSQATTNASARLYVTERPWLVFTEVMASPSGGSLAGHHDWFELSNLGTTTVNLLGYRFSDQFALAGAFRITNSIFLHPGESVVFVERMLAPEFIEWWGAERLPPGLKIGTYNGFGLKSSGEALHLWNSAATEDEDVLAAGAFLQSTDGVSLRFQPDDYYFTEDSVLGRDGAFRAANGGDVGSPGLLANPRPRFISITESGSNVSVRCRVTQGARYTLQTKERLTDPSWSPVSTNTADDFVLTIARPSGTNATRFFSLKELP